MQSTPTDLLTRRDAAKQLRVSLRTVDSLIATGDIPVVRIGSAVRIRPAALERLVDARETKGIRAKHRKSVRPKN